MKNIDCIRIRSGYSGLAEELEHYGLGKDVSDHSWWNAEDNRSLPPLLFLENQNADKNFLKFVDSSSDIKYLECYRYEYNTARLNRKNDIRKMSEPSGDNLCVMHFSYKGAVFGVKIYNHASSRIPELYNKISNLHNIQYENFVRKCRDIMKVGKLYENH
ncbi:hypothetical protein ZPAH1_orf00044 [Aeromonas phage ZPAH1]|nr:hypothetical protein ZPAH1_orf00044 [Aeromonas phage ZPAH1]